MRSPESGSSVRPTPFRGFPGQEVLTVQFLGLGGIPCSTATYIQNGMDSMRLLRRARAIRSDLKVIVAGERDAARVVAPSGIGRSDTSTRP